MSITLDDVSCIHLLHITCTFLDHSPIQISEVINLMVAHLGVDSGETYEEDITSRGAHAQISFLKDTYEGHLTFVVTHVGDNARVIYHR